ncbi:MAG: hypothetical protein ACP5T0_01845 [Verrucomicrobiia bacterium]
MQRNVFKRFLNWWYVTFTFIVFVALEVAIVYILLKYLGVIE